MLRAAIYSIAIAGLLINALTPKAIDSDIQKIGLHLRYSAHVSRPRSQCNLRISSRAFSCPPIPHTVSEDATFPEAVAMEQVTAWNPLAEHTVVASPCQVPDLLNWQCRLNI
jgi:hypothetical protein